MRCKNGAVALARKVLCLTHHLLVNQEMYEEVGRLSKRDAPIPKNKNQGTLTIKDMIQCIAQAGYVVKRLNSGMHG